jgi:cytochrome c peroxidase
MPRSAARLASATAALAVALAGNSFAERPNAVAHWWAPGEGRTLPASVSFSNEHGRIGILNTGGAVDTRGQPFFEPLGTNGRACVTCHQPADAMSLSVDSARARWDASGGRDPLFAGIDGANCPHLPQAERASHSLLLDRGLFRVFLPWPPRARDGSAIEPEFKLEVVRDPTGCNTHPKYGLTSETPTVSVYRRPRPVANLKYVTAAEYGVTPFSLKDSRPAQRDPATGKLVNMNMMADAREPTLATQAVSAALTHLEMPKPPAANVLQRIVGFESQIYAAQIFDAGAGDLAEAGGPPALGPAALASGRTSVLGNNTTAYVFPIADVWRSLPRTGDAAHDKQAAYRESVARGHDVFFFRTFWIKDAMHINTVGLGNPIKRTCSTCHGMHMTGMDTANGWMDIGTTNLPWATEKPLSPWAKEKPEMPLFKITCDKAPAPHPFLGRVIYTQDPGRALVTGRCNDVGTIVLQQFRGLAARPPYFSNGSAATLRELVDFYDRRFNIQYSDAEKQDLVNFLATL